MYRHALLATLLLAIGPASARADGFLTPFVGANFGGDSSSCGSLTDCTPRRRVDYGVSMGTMGTGAGFEEDLSYTRNFFGAAPNVESSVFSAMSNVLVMGSGVRVRSYIVSGFGLMRPSVTIDQVRVESTVLAYDWGGGVNGYITRHAGFRIDMRYFKTLQDAGMPLDAGKLSFWRASLGLALKF